MSFRQTAKVKPTGPSRRRSRRNAGFVLIEVLVAVGVASALMAVLLRSFVTTWSGVNVVREEAECTMLARSMLDEALLRNTLSPGSQEGTMARYAWNVTTTVQTVTTVAATQPQQQGQNRGEARQAPTTANIFHVVITMRGPSGRSSRLDAFKIGPSPAAPQ